MSAAGNTRGWVGRGVSVIRGYPLLSAAIAIGLAARIVTWVVTERRLDDAMITLKFDKNLAAGAGLVHNLGDGHVQGFTSALSVLVPLPGELVAAGGGLLTIRLVSLLAFVATAIFAYRILRELGVGPWPIGFALAYLALDQNQIFYGVAGMETQIAVAVLLGGIYYVLTEDFVRSGVALGLAPLARPDFVLWLVPAFLFLLFRNRRAAGKAALIAAAIVVPWLIFTSAYYGSPVPNTIAAKALVFSPHLPSLLDPGGWIDYLRHTATAHKGDWTVLAPFLERFLIAHTPLSRELLKLVVFGVCLLAITGAVTTWRRPSWRPAIAFVVLWIGYKLVYLGIGYFEWYGVPALAVIILLAAIGLDRLTRPIPSLAAVGATALAVFYAIHLPFTLPLEARVQHDIEDRVRQPLGEYLGRVVKPGQSLTSESSGYVGYDTNGTLYDLPGLESTTVVDTLSKAGPSYYTVPGVVYLLHPDWLVLRPSDLSGLRQTYPKTAASYTVTRRFRVSEDQSSLNRWGLSIINVDRDFIVMRRLAHPYLSSPGAFGTPGYRAGEIAAGPRQARLAADKVLARRLELGPAGPPRGASCKAHTPAPGAAGFSLRLRFGRTLIRDRSAQPVAIGMGRFQVQGPSVQLGLVQPGRWMALTVPHDGAAVPWTLFGGGPLTVCAPRG
jgi:hypothetical protein